jgi:hypothetical protein
VVKIESASRQNLGTQWWNTSFTHSYKGLCPHCDKNYNQIKEGMWSPQRIYKCILALMWDVPVVCVNKKHVVGDSQNTTNYLFATAGVQDSNNYTFRPFPVAIIRLYIPSFKSMYYKLTWLWWWDLNHRDVQYAILSITLVTSRFKLLPYKRV